MKYTDALKWRYATKQMNGQAVPAGRLERILEAVWLAPSSYGLQPYHLLVIPQSELLSRIHAEAAPQPQLLTCSHLLVFAVWDQISDTDVDAFMRLTAEQRQIPVSDLAAYADTIKATVNGFPSPEEQRHWAARQAYIGLGLALSAAAFEQVDATPMEGFDPGALDRVLNLEERGLRSVVITALGYRDQENDWLASATKVRWAPEDFISRLR